MATNQVELKLKACYYFISPQLELSIVLARTKKIAGHIL